MRIFIAISIPDKYKTDFESLKIGIHGVKWVLFENLHLTLRFLGKISQLEVEELAFALTDLEWPQFDLKVSGVGYFSRRDRVHSVWTGLVDPVELLKIRKKIENICIKSGFRPEPRKFKPHITIGRAKALPVNQIAPWLITHSSFYIDRIRVKNFVLFDSRLGREGPHYRVLKNYKLI